MRKFICILFALLVLVGGVTHATITVFHNPLMLRTNLVGLGLPNQLDRNGRTMVATMPEENQWNFVMASRSDIERVSERQLERRRIRQLELQLDNWTVPAGIDADEAARMRATVEEALAIRRANFRAEQSDVLMDAVRLFLAVYMLPFAALMIAFAVPGKNKERN